jgi:hypothetical protein
MYDEDNVRFGRWVPVRPSKAIVIEEPEPCELRISLIVSSHFTRW